MRKYLSIFKVSFVQELAYRINFIMWRVRNVLQILLMFFLWSTVFADQGTEIFGYNRDKILTYVFGIYVLRALVMATKAADISGEISRGDLTNYLLKPINYGKYWFVRDIASKVLNMGFVVVEVLILSFLLKPPLYVQTDPLMLLLFIVAVLLAILLFFGLMLLVNFFTFWLPEAGWSSQFLIIVIFTGFLSGSMFPLDVLPAAVLRILYALPFPYLLFFPLQIYLGKLSTAFVLSKLVVCVFWTGLILIAVSRAWHSGLKKYTAVGI